MSDLAGVYHGHDGVRRYWTTWLSAWQPIEEFDYELRDSGNDVVALITGQRNRGRHSGAEVEVAPWRQPGWLSEAGRPGREPNRPRPQDAGTTSTALPRRWP